MIRGGPCSGRLERAAWLLVFTLLAGTALVGCTTQEQGPAADGDGEPTTLYTHRWTYGPGYGGTDELPVFEDAFQVPQDAGTWDVRIPTWRGDDGSFPQGHVELEGESVR